MIFWTKRKGKLLRRNFCCQIKCFT